MQAEAGTTPVRRVAKFAIDDVQVTSYNKTFVSALRDTKPYFFVRMDIYKEDNCMGRYVSLCVIAATDGCSPSCDQAHSVLFLIEKILRDRINMSYLILFNFQTFQ